MPTAEEWKRSEKQRYIREYMRKYRKDGRRGKLRKAYWNRKEEKAA